MGVPDCIHFLCVLANTPVFRGVSIYLCWNSAFESSERFVVFKPNVLLPFRITAPVSRLELGILKGSDRQCSELRRVIFHRAKKIFLQVKSATNDLLKQYPFGCFAIKYSNQKRPVTQHVKVKESFW